MAKLTCVCMFFLVSLACSEQGYYGQLKLNPKTGRIINGQITDIRRHPYQAALVNIKTKRIICGGVLVKPRVVFTAAHCTYLRDDTPRKNLGVLLGVNHLDDPDGWIHTINRTIKHPGFSYVGLDSDFSIILLNEPAQISERVQPIRITNNDFDTRRTTAVVSGWGRTETGQPSRDLRDVYLTIEKHNKCQDYFPGVFHPRITRNMVCVVPHYKSTYYGDSGGPLVVNDELVGLVSFGRPLGPNLKTTVFTRVKNFVRFANSVIPDEYKNE